MIRKLSAPTRHDPTRKAIFEFDKLVRSIYPDYAVLDAGKLAKIEMPNRNGFISPNPRPDAPNVSPSRFFGLLAMRVY